MLEWYERLLFGKPGHGHRGGALALLSQKVTRIRNGEFTEVDRNVEVFPVLLTYEDLGDNVAFGAWMDERVKQLGLFAQPRVAPITIANIAQYETIMGLASNGVDMFTILGQSRPRESRYRQLQQVIHSVPASVSRRVPGHKELINSIFVRASMRLFARSLENEDNVPRTPSDP